jgi:hypothetical protein
MSPTFYVFCAQLFGTYNLDLNFFVERIVAQKPHINNGEIDTFKFSSEIAIKESSFLALRCRHLDGLNFTNI